MQFYQSIAEYYDHIFPTDETQVDFVKTSIPRPHSGKGILDIGCGTGSLAVALGRHGFRVAGIDLDAAMVKQAEDKGRGLPYLSFRQLDMRSLSGMFSPSSFDGILCFGNTLVHLKDREEVLGVCRTSKALLKSGGKFLLQILNYDRILVARLPGLPTIENDRVKFQRLYRYNDDGSILFRTVLTVKATDLVVENEVPLYPLGRGEVETMLSEAGFAQIRIYGDFRRVPLMPESLPLVVEASV
jgi:glycine/sarcosine N-methyltransferase